MSDDGTILAPATPALPSARAILRLSGPHAHAAVQRVTGIPPSEGSFRCRIRTGLGEAPVLALVFRGPSTATGEHTAELHLPGSPFLVRAAMDALMAGGLVRLAEPGEFTRRAFLNGRMDLARAEAVMELISASGESQARAASITLSGGFSRRLEALVGKLEDLCARLELSFDFDEEVAEQADVDSFRGAAVDVYSALCELQKPVFGATGDVPRVVIAGPSNPGKSTLFNALVGHRRAAVADEHGTTRDAVACEWQVGGLAAVLVDTAGFRPPSSPIEDEAIVSTIRSIRDAAVVILCCADGVWEAGAEERISRALSGHGPEGVIRVLTKSDLPGAPAPDHVLRLSCHAGVGLDSLRQAVTRQLSGGRTADAPWVSSRVHALCSIAESELTEALSLLDGGRDLPLASSLARSALSNLREALGRGASTDILDHAFANFCIGK